MEMVEVLNGVWWLPGSVNMGLVRTEVGFVAVDTGLDKRAGKLILKAVEELGGTLCSIVNTHAHADHFGGNATILKQVPAKVYAPRREAPVIQNPRFEPEYLWNGAAPFADLENKFLMADPSPVDYALEETETFYIGETAFQCISLPGHAHGQVGIVVSGACFAADAYFDAPVIEKHGIPFLVDYHATLASANSLLEIEADWFIPGHGVGVKNPRDAISTLTGRHEDAVNRLHRILKNRERTLDEATSALCQEFHLSPTNAGSWLLIRTSVAAYLSGLIQDGMIAAEVKTEGLVFTASVHSG